MIECDPCANAERERRTSESRQKSAAAAWLAHTPPDMQARMDRLRIHPELVPALDTDGTHGCALIGASDSGKTRVGYYLLRKAAKIGISGMAITHAAFRKAASHGNSGDPRRADHAHDLLKACRTTPALLIDDLGKGASTQVADEAFFDMLTYRRDHRMLTHWTANAGSGWLANRFGQDKARPILVRLTRLTDGHVYVAEPKNKQHQIK